MKRREFGERFQVRSVDDPDTEFTFQEVVEVITVRDPRGRRPDEIRRHLFTYLVDDRDDLTGFKDEVGLGIRMSDGQEYRVERLI